MNLDALAQTLMSSDLSVQEQAEFLSYFEPARTEQIAKLVEILHMHPAWIRSLYHNISRKKDILARGDMAAWQNLLLDEFSQITHTT